MKANELMIGDWVQHYNGDNVKIIAFYGYNADYMDKRLYTGCTLIKKLEPIPLTAEILNKNFPKPTGEYWVEGDFPIIGYSIPCITDGHRPYVEVSIYDPARVMEFEMFFHYVHELQHALKLCGIEKEIEL